MSVVVDQTFEGAEVLGNDEYHYFLWHVDCSMADMIMPLEKATRLLRVGNLINVTVEAILIADDGTPGAFVRM